GHLVKIELEVDTLDQLAEALEVGVDAVLLDNMTPETLRRAVAMVDGGAVTEASGRITLETASQIAATGVDLISSGWITHSAPILDLGLDVADGRTRPTRTSAALSGADPAPPIGYSPKRSWAETVMHLFKQFAVGDTAATAQMIPVIDYGPYFARVPGALESLAIEVAMLAKMSGSSMR